MGRPYSHIGDGNSRAPETLLRWTGIFPAIGCALQRSSGERSRFSESGGESVIATVRLAREKRSVTVVDHL